MAWFCRARWRGKCARACFSVMCIHCWWALVSSYHHPQITHIHDIVYSIEICLYINIASLLTDSSSGEERIYMRDVRMYALQFAASNWRLAVGTTDVKWWQANSTYIKHPLHQPSPRTRTHLARIPNAGVGGAGQHPASCDVYPENVRICGHASVDADARAVIMKCIISGNENVIH